MDQQHHAHVGFWIAILAGIVVLVYGVFAYQSQTNAPSEEQTTENQPYLPGLSSSGKLPTDRPLILDSDLVVGPPDAKVTIVEFGDYTCVSCGLAVPVLNQVFERYPMDIRIVWKDYVQQQAPSRSARIAEAGRCANEQEKFWKMNNLLLQNQPAYSDEELFSAARTVELSMEPFSECLSSNRHELYIANGKREGDALGIDATPYFFVNLQRLSGVPTFDQLSSLIEEELRR